MIAGMNVENFGMGLGHQFSTLLELLFSFRGRISRGAYNWCTATIFLVLVLIIEFGGNLLSVLRGEPGTGNALGVSEVALGVLLIGLLGLLSWILVALGVKRLHDRNRTGWIWPLTMVPIVAIWPGFEMYLLRSPNKPNRFGDEPCGTIVTAGRRVGWVAKGRALFVDLLGIIIFFILYVLIRAYIFEPFSIPSESNFPTLLVGDYIFVSKYGYSLDSAMSFGRTGRTLGTLPKIGDVVVFKLPSDPSVTYVKRVAGLPGDEVQVLHGQLYLNGTGVQRMQVADFIDDFGTKHQQFVETLPNNIQYRILQESENGPLDNTEIFKVPPGHIFVLGDNRSSSQDSRMLSELGYVPLRNIVGRAEFRFFSFVPHLDTDDLLSWPDSVRWSRLFTIVR